MLAAIARVIQLSRVVSGMEAGEMKPRPGPQELMKFNLLGLHLANSSESQNESGWLDQDGRVMAESVIKYC